MKMIEIKYEGRILKKVPEDQNYLYLPINDIKKISKIEGLDKLVNLNELDLSYNKISKIEGLEKLVNLKVLCLSYNKISKIEGLDKLVNLNEFDLSYNNITKIEGLDKLVNLNEFYLSKNQISKIEGLDKLKNLTILQALNLFCKKGVLEFQRKYNLPENFSGSYLENHPGFKEMLQNNYFLLFCVKMIQGLKNDTNNI